MNAADINKSSSKSASNESNNFDMDNTINNNYYYIPKSSHFRKWIINYVINYFFKNNNLFINNKFIYLHYIDRQNIKNNFTQNDTINELIFI